MKNFDSNHKTKSNGFVRVSRYESCAIGNFDIIILPNFTNLKSITNANQFV